MEILLTQYQGSILGPIAKVLGIIMNGIFNMLDAIGIPNIGLAIILFTIVIYLLLMPLTIKQQKFSKLSAKMNPELQAIQAKYKGKKDNESMAKQNEEMQTIYKKYGVSPTGSCVQLVIQMPILFALYRVIYSMPAYVKEFGNTFKVLADSIISQNGLEYIKGLDKAKTYTKNFDLDKTNAIIDVLNNLSTKEMTEIAAKFNLNDLTYQGSLILSKLNDKGEVVQRGLIDTYNNFLGLNIANSPSYMMKEAIASKSFLIVIAALMIPALAALTQWINTLFMPQADTSNSDNPMASSMKTMNIMMPLMSAVFCFTLPAGMGLYWIAGAIVRSIQQVVINKHIDKMDIDALIEKNMKKNNAKREKMGLPPQSLTSNANVNTKKVNTPQKSQLSQKEKDKAIEEATKYYEKNAKPGSIAAKANMVKQYNEKNQK